MHPPISHADVLSASMGRFCEKNATSDGISDGSDAALFLRTNGTGS
jgi:hypothetical protein